MSTAIAPRTFKIILVGDTGTGKTSFIDRYTQDTFANGHKATIGVDFMTKNIETPNKNTFNMQLWDTAGRERFMTTIRGYYRSAAAFLVFYDITKRDSLGHVKAWFDDINNHQDREGILKVIIGTKIDLANKRQVSFEEASELAQHLGALFFEVSAKENINISEAMTAVAAELESRPKPTPLATVPDPKSAPTKESSSWSFRCNIL